MLHAQEDKLVLFKQYANQCSKNGLIEFEWKKRESGLVIPVYKSHNETITPLSIEDQYNTNPKRTSQATDNKKAVAQLFKDKGFVVTERGEACYQLTRAQLEEGLKDKVRWAQAHKIITEDLKGFWTGSKKTGLKWHIRQKLADYLSPGPMDVGEGGWL